MPGYVALLRGINVGGHGKLAMRDLTKVCEAAEFENVKTYIQSGNVVFTSRLSEARVQQKLVAALTEHMGKPVAVIVRTAAELGSVLHRNPFPNAAPNQVLILFLDKAPALELFASLKTPGGEEVRVTGREVFVHYPNGMGRSKLKLPLVHLGTGRNLNTIAKLAHLSEELS